MTIVFITAIRSHSIDMNTQKARIPRQINISEDLPHMQCMYLPTKHIMIQSFTSFKIQNVY